jgi:hypothetical protein
MSRDVKQTNVFDQGFVQTHGPPTAVNLVFYERNGGQIGAIVTMETAILWPRKQHV